MSAVSYPALVAIISLAMTERLVEASVVANTLAITDITQATPMVVTTATPHGYVRAAHGIISGVIGAIEANDTWVLSPVSPSTLALSKYDAQGNVVQSVGTHGYTGGGQIQIAFPDGAILLGRRNVALSTSVAAPRIVFVPTRGAKWFLDGYGGEGAPADLPPERGGPEDQFQKLARNIGTRYATFEVYVSGASSPRDPDGGDFDAVLALTGTLYGVLFDLVTPYGAQVLLEDWPSQKKEAGSLTQSGQQWMGLIEFPLPLMDTALQFVPIGTYLELIVQPAGAAGSADQEIIIVP